MAKKPSPKKSTKKSGRKKKKAPSKSAGSDESIDKKPKGRQKPEIKWTEEDLKKAIALVKSGESPWKISRQFGIKYDILASATKVSLYGLMYSKCKGQGKSNSGKEETPDDPGKAPVKKEDIKEGTNNVEDNAINIEESKN